MSVSNRRQALAKKTDGRREHDRKFRLTAPQEEGKMLSGRSGETNVRGAKSKIRKTTVHSSKESNTVTQRGRPAGKEMGHCLKTSRKPLPWETRTLGEG